MLVFKPYQIKNVTINNRLVLSPMCTYSASESGEATDWHLVHYGTRAMGRVGLILLEATAVEDRGRISNKDLGIWDDKHIAGLRKITDFVKAEGVKIGIQLAHAGRESFSPELVAPSPIPYRQDGRIPRELTASEIRQIAGSFALGAKRALDAGFEIVEIHAAHGYLIHEFLSPLSNTRTDGYGGELKARFRFLEEIIVAVREVWPSGNPLFVRVSAVDYHRSGVSLEDTIEICKWLRELGVDLIDVSSGGILPDPPPHIYPGYQVAFAEAIRNQAKIKTGAVGLIKTLDQAEEILGNQRADLVFIGRELLRNPYLIVNQNKEWMPAPYADAVND